MSVLDDWHRVTDQWPIVPFIVGALFIPYLIAYLSFDLSTRWLRIGLWPVGVFCYFAALGRVGDGLLDMRVAHQGYMAVFGSGIRYSFATEIPVFHHLPRRPFLSSLRSTRACRAFDLLYSENKGVTVSPRIPHFARSIRLVFALTMFDIVTYPIVYFAPKTYGPIHIDDYPNFVGWVKDLSGQLGLNWVIVWTFFAWCYALGMVFGFEMGAHLAVRKSFAEVPESSPVQWALYLMGQPNLIDHKA